MFSMFGAAVFVIKILGVAVVIATLLTALLYHMGWRNDHPNGFWPTSALVGFGGILLAGTGLIIGSLLAIIVGICAYFCSLVLSPKSPPPPAA
jgi:hypothetical protein